MVLAMRLCGGRKDRYNPRDSWSNSHSASISNGLGKSRSGSPYLYRRPTNGKPLIATACLMWWCRANPNSRGGTLLSCEPKGVRWGRGRYCSRVRAVVGGEAHPLGLNRASRANVSRIDRTPCGTELAGVTVRPRGQGPSQHPTPAHGNSRGQARRPHFLLPLLGLRAPGG